MDGIEDDPARQATMGIYVPGVADWFSPFNDYSVVHPYAETQPTARPAVHDLFRRVSDTDADQAIFDSPLLNATTPITGLGSASQAATAEADPTAWVADVTDPERSFTTLLAAAEHRGWRQRLAHLGTL